MGRRGAHAEGPHQCRHAGRRPRRASSAPRASACAAPSTCSSSDRIIAVRQMILAETSKARHAALAKLLPMQRGDFEGIFKAMDGLPVTIRLLDPPLHEFLPHKERRSRRSPAPSAPIRKSCAPAPRPCTSPTPCSAIAAAGWASPIPEIYEMQARAILEAAVERGSARRRAGELEIMIPLVGFKSGTRSGRRASRHGRTVDAETENEAHISDRHHDRTAARRAAGRRDRQTAEFFSFGTNDLTQTTWASAATMPASFSNIYMAKGVIARDPFVSIDVMASAN